MAKSNYTSKLCSNCQKRKILKEFYRRKDSPDGYRNQCKHCFNVKCKEWRNENKGKIQAYSSQYYEKNKITINEYKRGWAKENPEKVRQYQANYRKNHPETYKRYRRNLYKNNEDYQNNMKKLSREWRQNNKNKRRDYEAQRRAAKKIGKETILISRKRVWKRDKGICHICGLLTNKNDWHLDHIRPLSRGGKHIFNNVAVSHPKCNLAKKDKLMEEFNV